MPTSWTKINKATGTSWTKIPKPTDGTSTIITAGMPIGLLLALTYGSGSTINTSNWTKITKAAGTAWTKITKAT